MLLIYCRVRRIEARSLQWQFGSSKGTDSNNVDAPGLREENQMNGWNRRYGMADLPKTRRVSYQAVGYTMCFIMVYLFPTTSRIMSNVGDGPPYAIRLLAVTFVSSQGFWNWVIYFCLPRIANWWEQRRPASRRTLSASQPEEADPKPAEG